MNPNTISDSPIPLLDGSILNSFGQTSNPSTGNDEDLQKIYADRGLQDLSIAQDVQSQSFDSETKRIKGAYEFESLGSLKIGQFQQGVSGEINISSDGIIATNSDGDETINLDGTDGDATFFGTVNAQGFDIADTTGLISLNNFLREEIFSIGTQSTSSTSYVDITGSSMNPLVLERDSVILLGMMIQGLNDENISSQAHSYGDAIIYDDFTNAGITNMDFPGQSVTYTPDGEKISEWFFNNQKVSKHKYNELNQ